MPLEQVTVDGVVYDTASLQDGEKEMIQYYELWNKEAGDAKRDLLKSQAAMRDVANEIIKNVRAYEGHADSVAALVAQKKEQEEQTASNQEVSEAQPPVDLNTAG